MGRSWPWTLGLVFLASLLLICSALPPPPPPGSGSTTTADEAILARVCDPRGPRPAWCDELHLRRRFLRGVARHGHSHHHHQHHRVPVPQPPPGRDEGDEIDPRYGVSKRRVPTGPNPLHN